MPSRPCLDSVLKRLIFATVTERPQTNHAFVPRYTDASLGESFEMRIYDRDTRVPADQVRMILDKGVLEEHGFKLEITSKLLREPGSRSDKPSFLTTHFFFKTVDCSQVPEVNEEVDSLIPGILITENNHPRGI